MRPILVVLAVLFLGSPAAAAPRATRKACATACRDRVAECIAGGSSPRKCARDWRWTCRYWGVEGCAPPTSSTTSSSSTSSSTSTTSTTTSSTTTSTVIESYGGPWMFDGYMVQNGCGAVHVEYVTSVDVQGPGDTTFPVIVGPTVCQGHLVDDGIEASGGVVLPDGCAGGTTIRIGGPLGGVSLPATISILEVCRNGFSCVTSWSGSLTR